MYEQLIEAGLTRTEAKLYVMLVNLGRSQAGALSRKTGIHRRSVYDALERLIEKGLVSFIRENNKRIYLPTDPNRFKEIMEEKAAMVENVLPELLAKFNMAHDKEETLFFRGAQGIKAILDDQIKAGKNIYVIGGRKKAKEVLPFSLYRFSTRRIKRKAKLYMIYAGKYEDAKKIPFSESRYLPEKFTSPVATNIYGDNVAIIVWSTEPVAVMIRNKDIARTYKQYFDVLWRMAKPLHKSA